MKTLAELAKAFEDYDGPEVSGAITKTYHFKVRVALPLNNRTRFLNHLDKWDERHALLKELEEGLKLQSTLGLTVVQVLLPMKTAKIFQPKGSTDTVVVLCNATLAYSAHRVYSASELHPSLSFSLHLKQYSTDDVAVELLKT